MSDGEFTAVISGKQSFPPYFLQLGKKVLSIGCTPTNVLIAPVALITYIVPLFGSIAKSPPNPAEFMVTLPLLMLLLPSIAHTESVVLASRPVIIITGLGL